VAKNLVVDFYREKSRLQIISASAVSEPLVEFNLEQEAALSLEIEKIRKVLSRLGEEQQEVIIWHYLDGLSHKEIAAILDKPEGTVRVIVHRALEALRKELKCA
jgi:RNA polymerase sigma-70 factor (ECF subfamily)